MVSRSSLPNCSVLSGNFQHGGVFDINNTTVVVSSSALAPSFSLAVSYRGATATLTSSPEGCEMEFRLAPYADAPPAVLPNVRRLNPPHCSALSASR